MNKREAEALQEFKTNRERLLAEKRTLAAQLIGEGVSVEAIRRSLRCSTRLIREARGEA